MQSHLTRRSSGILLHPTSLSGPFPHGDIGPSARRFVDFLAEAGQRWWQMLPIHPIGGCDSPYDSPSAFAGSDLLISLEELVVQGLLSAEEIRSTPRTVDPHKASFSSGQAFRSSMLRAAFGRFTEQTSHERHPAYDAFLAENGAWVWDYALFMALRRSHNLRSWTTWSEGLRTREAGALKAAHELHGAEIRFQVFCQFLFHDQWDQLRSYAAEKGVLLMGDVPMFVSHDSVDVWANPELFYLDEAGARTVQAGVPPDYFSEDGQLWGNPLYRWDVMGKNGYGWWTDRLRRELKKFDAVRLDHFIALSRYWEIPMGVSSARGGRYVDVPGADFLAHVSKALGGLPFIAEDLGIVTPEVVALRDQFKLPGMKVLQFAFSPGAEAYLPHRHPESSVAYLGTHDNGTTRGWFEALLHRASHGGEAGVRAKEELERVRGYTGVARTVEVNARLIRSLLSSPANTVVLTPQDLLDQGDEHRMNVPGVAEGNWIYRLAPGQLTPELAEELRSITVATERA